MKRALYPGTFDPPTFGHLDIIERACGLVDELYIGIANNHRKKPLFSLEKRIEFLKKLTQKIPNIQIHSIEGLTTEFAKAHGVTCLIRSIRSSHDFDYESAQAYLNHELSGIETLFIPVNPKYSFINSSLLKEIAINHGKLNHFIPDFIEKEINK